MPFSELLVLHRYCAHLFRLCIRGILTHDSQYSFMCTYTQASPKKNFANVRHTSAKPTAFTGGTDKLRNTWKNAANERSKNVNSRQ
jgi:hypothetical protein